VSRLKTSLKCSKCTDFLNHAFGEAYSYFWGSYKKNFKNSQLVRMVLE
jgi:hypothetical protein